MAVERQAFYLPKTEAQTDVPAAVRAGNLFFSSSITAKDPETGKLAGDGARQFDLAFRNLRAAVENAGLTADDIAHVTVFIPDASGRQLINKPWLEMFPDEHNRPARKTTTYPLPQGQLVQLQAFAVAGGRRQPLEIPGLAHRDPLPMGARAGKMVYSSVIGGQDPKTNKQVAGVKPQIDQAFQNMKALVEQAGGTTDNIGHVWVFMRDREDQPAMVDTWLKMFPEDGNRPARKTIMYDELKGRETLIQLQFTAVLEGKRKNYEIPGVGHHDPIPMGASLGNLFFSSGVGGYDAKTGERAEGLAAQAELAFENVRALMAQAQSTLKAVTHLTVMVRDYSAEPTVMKKFYATFSERDSRPACHMMALGLPGENLVQLHVIGVL
ncbi:MAG TPA: RidA family protein [Candidatus Acidoferrales bacterium]|nr:RidA family protein [Candidatus Acidoferrales bacterium]